MPYSHAPKLWLSIAALGASSPSVPMTKYTVPQDNIANFSTCTAKPSSLASSTLTSTCSAPPTAPTTSMLSPVPAKMRLRLLCVSVPHRPLPVAGYKVDNGTRTSGPVNISPAKPLSTLPLPTPPSSSGAKTAICSGSTLSPSNGPTSPLRQQIPPTEPSCVTAPANPPASYRSKQRPTSSTISSIRPIPPSRSAWSNASRLGHSKAASSP